MNTLHLPDAGAVEALGGALAAALGPGEAICLSGPLGAGKTTLARGLVRAFVGADVEVPSPTFTLAQAYDGPDFPLTHFDLYRLVRPDEAYEIGLDEALEDGAVIIEWPERLEGRLPADRLDIEIGLEDQGRTARLTGHGSWKDRAVEF